MEIQYYEHLCLCGCGGQIEIRKNHKYVGIPFYIKGHHFKGKHHSEEARQKIREANKGRKDSKETIEKRIQKLKGKKLSEETIQKQSIAAKERFLHEPGTNKGKKFTLEHSQNISKGNRGKIISEETRKKQSKAHLGKPSGMRGRKHSKETRQKMSEAQKGEKSWNWQNGKSFEEYGIEFNKELKQQVLERDNYTCQCLNCASLNETDLHIHHIDYDKTNNNLENLITLCNSCHSKTNPKTKRQYFTEFYQNVMINRIMECFL